jgi:hypothetical protein
MSVTPAFLHYNDFTDKTSVIPGEFDISKWVRPVECVFEIKKQTESIKILKGDAQCYFKFRSDETTPIKITRSQMPWKTIDQCAKLRAADPLKPLKFRYDSVYKTLHLKQDSINIWEGKYKTTVELFKLRPKARSYDSEEKFEFAQKMILILIILVQFNSLK